MESNPNLILLGAQKSGTTSLHQYLKFHPEIYMSSPIKEPRFFFPIDQISNYFKKLGHEISSKEVLFKKYMAKGYKGEKYFGDSTTSYTIGDWSRKYKLAESMFLANESTKFIYLVRHPLERMISHYLHYTRNHSNPKSFNVFLRSDPYVLQNSLYSFQLEPYLAVFPKRQFLICHFLELVNSPAELLDKIAQFLNIEKFKPIKEFGVFNKSRNRSGFQDETLKFGKYNWERILPVVIDDVKKMNDIFEMNVVKSWSFDKATWTNY